LTIQYPIKYFEQGFFRSKQQKQFLYKQVWTKDSVTIHEDGVETTTDNLYGTIPFVQILNVPIAGRSYGLSDLYDVIPLNVELNLKTSAVSEIIDYHASPVTVVFGASIKNLEKGANKIWGGLPKEAKVENLGLESNLEASLNYIREIKETMDDVARVPSGALGGAQKISNTSGVALQFANMPIIERIRLKNICTTEGIKQINKLILLISEKEGLINIPKGIDRKKFFKTDIKFSDCLPKDLLLELQQIQLEMQLGLEERKGALQRLGRENTPAILESIDKEKEEHPEYYGVKTQINSGINNGETAIEQVRKETTGKNG
jgi:hypothetical protein